MQRDNLQGARGRRSAQKGRWAALPLTPLRFSLCTLFPQTPNPLPATAMCFPVSFREHIFVGFLSAIFGTGKPFLFCWGVNRAHNVCPYKKE